MNTKCEDKIEQHLRDRIEDIKVALAGHFEEGIEDLIDWLHSVSLSYEEDTHYRAWNWALSWGGPSDGFRFFEDGAIEYYFMDWFDGATRELRGEQLEVLRELYSRCFDCA